MSTKERLTQDIKEAMRAGDKNTLGALRLISSAIKQVEVDKRIEVDEELMLEILSGLAKQRKESISHFESAGRQDLVAKEQFELALISNYLPEPLSEAQVETLIAQAIKELDAQKISDMGKVMAWLKPRLQGRADMGKVSAVIKAKLT